jgi:hypothetical protein
MVLRDFFGQIPLELCHRRLPQTVDVDRYLQESAIVAKRPVGRANRAGRVTYETLG